MAVRPPRAARAAQARFRLRELLDEAGLSIKEFSRRSGICYPSAHDMVRNRTRRVDLATLERACDALSCEPADLITLQPAAPEHVRASGPIYPE